MADDEPDEDFQAHYERVMARVKRIAAGIRSPEYEAVKFAADTRSEVYEYTQKLDAIRALIEECRTDLRRLGQDVANLDSRVHRLALTVDQRFADLTAYIDVSLARSAGGSRAGDATGD
jgi:hypothetical protein